MPTESSDIIAPSLHSWDSESSWPAVSMGAAARIARRTPHGTRSGRERHTRAQHSAGTVCTHPHGGSCYRVQRWLEGCRAVLSVTCETGAPPESDTQAMPEQSLFRGDHDGQLSSEFHILQYTFLPSVRVDDTTGRVFLHAPGEASSRETWAESPVIDACALGAGVAQRTRPEAARTKQQQRLPHIRYPKQGFSAQQDARQREGSMVENSGVIQ